MRVAEERRGTGVAQKPPRSLERRNRAGFDGRSSSERGVKHGSSAKTIASQPWVGYAVRARKAKTEILANMMEMRALWTYCFSGEMDQDR